MNIPVVDWPRVAGRVQRTWRPDQVNPHQVAYGLSRAGKDWLWRYGVLKLKPGARALVLDVKQNGGDPTYHGWADDIPISEWRPDSSPGRARLLVPLGDLGAKLTRRALEAIAEIGEHILILPDAGRITETTKRGGFGLDGMVSRIMSECASAGVTVLAGVGSPAYSGAGIRAQAGRVWLGQTLAADVRTAFADMASLPREARPALDTLPAHHFLYADYLDGTGMYAITKAPAQ